MNKYRVNGVVLMSGDVHTGEIMRNPCSKQRTGYDLYEITSSGMTHSARGLVKYFAESWIPPTYHTRYQNLYQDLNFGIIDVNFTNGHVANISLQIRNKEGSIVREQVLPYLSLIRNEKLIGGHENCSIYVKSPLRRLLEYHLTHFTDPTTLEAKRGIIMYSIFFGVLSVGLLVLFLLARAYVCLCRYRKKDYSVKREKLE